MILKSDIELGNFRDTALESLTVTAENLRTSLEKINGRYSLDEIQRNELTRWAMERYETLTTLPENSFPGGEERRRTDSYPIVTLDANDQTNAGQKPMAINKKRAAEMVYIIANDRAREITESERLNPYLLSRQGMKNELNKRIESIDDDPDKILVLVAFDLDDFKIVNDLFGHLRGDELLVAMGKSLETSMRAFDMGAHYSGDEFGFMLEIDTTSSDFKEENIPNIVTRVIQNIIVEIQDLVKRPEGDDTKQEFSAGFRIIKKDEGLSVEQIMEDSDNASYASKELKYLRKQTKQGGIDSKDRIVDFSNINEELADFTPEQRRKAALLNKLRRPIHDAYPELNPEALTKMIATFFKMFETTVSVSSIPDDELEDEVKKFIGKIVRTQQDNEAAKRFFTSADKWTDKEGKGQMTNPRFVGNKKTKAIHLDNYIKETDERDQTLMQKIRDRFGI